jgi:hypothetical protein
MCNGLPPSKTCREILQHNFNLQRGFLQASRDALMAEVGESGLRMCRPVPQEVLDAVESVCFIADHLKKGDRENSVSICNFLLKASLLACRNPRCKLKLCCRISLQVLLGGKPLH